jgi:energy-coupling factor transporter ATP-binding protein EcfA2
MRITRLATKNYRTLENLDLSFPAFYSAICGRNDSGKTNVVRAIRCLMKEEEPFRYIGEPEFSLNTDFTKWVDGGDPKVRSIRVAIDLSISPESDTGLFEFLREYLGLGAVPGELGLTVEVTHSSDGVAVEVSTGGQRFDGLKAQEVLKKLQTSRTFLFHSSTDPDPRFRRRFRGVLADITEEYTSKLEQSKKSLDRVLRRIAREQQEEIEDLLGRLADRYKVGLTIPSLDIKYFPYELTLGDRKVEVELDEWGSGTRNRTMVLLTIFRAKQVAESPTSASKVTPVIVVEEPESFLHPLAQAEFGRVLQDLSEEFRVQIIVTTHSPYLLSQDRPESNILLKRRVTRGQLRATERADTTGANWMEPFSLALGIADDEFRPWRELFFSRPEALLLVEGDTDREYFTLLRDPAHGDHRLAFEGEVFPYGGRDTLKNQALLKFIKDRFGAIFITFDLDAEGVVERPLQALGFEKRRSYLPVGVDAPGKKNIEGLLPESVRTAIYAENPDLVQALTGSTDERREAHGKLKRLLLDRFKRDARPGADYENLYEVARIINRAFKRGA